MGIFTPLTLINAMMVILSMEMDVLTNASSNLNSFVLELTLTRLTNASPFKPSQFFNQAYLINSYFRYTSLILLISQVSKNIIIDLHFADISCEFPDEMALVSVKSIEFTSLSLNLAFTPETTILYQHVGFLYL